MSKYLLALTAMLASVSAYALPFNIVPLGTLPTTVISGNGVFAFFTVTNNTVTARDANFVKSLPPNVIQITSDANIPNLCGATFDLAPFGAVGDSCVLELLVTGAVNPNDTNPLHHLFVCFPGGTTCAGPGPQNQLNVTATPAFGTLLAVGLTNTGSGNFPVIFDSRLTSLTTPPTFHLADLSMIFTQLGVTGGQFNFSNCTGNICVADGQYNPFNGPSQFPLTAYSTTSGQLWAAVDIPSLIPDLQQGAALSSACTGKTCISVGNYTTSVDTFPLLLVTNNGTATWSLVNTSAYSGSDATLNTASCAAPSFCFAGGVSNSLPLLLQTNNGQSFSSVNVISLIPGATSAMINASSCSGSICIAAGTYNTNSAADLVFALRTTNNGATWSFIDLSGVTFGDFDTVASASCSGLTCLIGGSDFSNNLPLLLLSNDGGITWSYVDTTQFLPVVVGNIFGVYCDSTMCAADGIYFPSSGPGGALLLVTQDHGATWTAIDTSAYPFGSLNQTACVDNICISGGQDGTLNPLLLLSMDNGSTWSRYNLNAVQPGIITGNITYTAGG